MMGRGPARIAIFTSANESYVPKTILALQSFRRWHPEYSYFILGTKALITLETQRLIEANNIEFIDVDDERRMLRSDFSKKSFPIETFYILKGPQLLAERGFDYSISIDGDVFCYRPLQLWAFLGSVTGIAGRPVGTFSRTLENKLAEKNLEFDFSLANLAERYGLVPERVEPAVEINGGFVIWNNNAMKELSFFEKSVSLTIEFKGCFKGNQDLVAFMSVIYNIPVNKLDYNYHFLLDYNKLNLSEAEDGAVRDIERDYFGDVRVLHFIQPKPWLVKEPIFSTHRHFFNAWREFAVKEFASSAAELLGSVGMIESGDPLEEQTFLCIGREVPCATESTEDTRGRTSKGAAGHLVFGPYFRVCEEGLYCAELSYRTNPDSGSHVGVFDVTASRMERNGEVVLRALGSVDLAPTEGLPRTARVEFSTIDTVLSRLETRVHVEEGVIMTAYCIRVWRIRTATDVHVRMKAVPAVGRAAFSACTSLSHTGDESPPISLAGRVRHWMGL